MAQYVFAVLGVRDKLWAKIIMYFVAFDEHHQDRR